MKHAFMALLCICVAGCAQSPRTPAPAAIHIVAAAWQTGVTVADERPGYTSSEAESTYIHLKNIGVRWVALTPGAFIADVHSPTIRWRAHDNYTDAIAMLHKQGIAVMLKPYLWSAEFYRQGLWTGDIAMTSDADWKTFFENYSAFIMNYANVAEQSGAEMLCVGLELPKTLDHADDWKQLIRNVRSVYHGKLTYASAGLDEARNVPFWNNLDFIGVNAYFHLTDDTMPTEQELCNAWMPIEMQLDSLSKQHQKKILFTEAGYRSCVGTACKPWEWVERDSKPVDINQQALCYDVLCKCLFDKSWFAGIYWWKYYPDMSAGGKNDDDFTPQNKPAERVIKKWFNEKDSLSAANGVE